jgi:hypothetical protein
VSLPPLLQGIKGDTLLRKDEPGEFDRRLRERFPVGSSEAALVQELLAEGSKPNCGGRCNENSNLSTNDPPALHPSIALLQRNFEGLHVGGTSALDWHGIRQYVSQRPALHLYGWKAGRLPEWFTQRFPAEYHRKRLFEERPCCTSGLSRTAKAGRWSRRQNARCSRC